MNTPPKEFVRDLYIHRPTSLRNRHKIAFPVLTAIAWAAYLYLWLPLASLVLWWGAGLMGRRELAQHPEFIDFDLFLIVLKALAAALVVLLGWAEYNRWRFQGEDRRAASPELEPIQTAIAMGLPVALAQEIRQVRRAVLVLGGNAMPIDVELYPTTPDPVLASSRTAYAVAGQAFP